MEVCYALVGEMLRLGGVVKAADASREQLQGLIADGSALQCFRELIEAQGGDPSVVDQPERLPQAERVEVLQCDSQTAAYVAGVDAHRVERLPACWVPVGYSSGPD